MPHPIQLNIVMALLIPLKKGQYFFKKLNYSLTGKNLDFRSNTTHKRNLKHLRGKDLGKFINGLYYSY